MKSKFTKIIASLLALGALAMGGSAIASATSGGGNAPIQSSEQKAEPNEGVNDGDSSAASESAESESGPEGADDNQGQDESGDPSESVDAASSQKAMAAAEAKTGGKADEVSVETSDKGGDKPEKGDTVDKGEQASPAGAAYEVDVTKGSSELKVYLDSQFQILQVQAEQAD